MRHIKTYDNLFEYNLFVPDEEINRFHILGYKSMGKTVYEVIKIYIGPTDHSDKYWFKILKKSTNNRITTYKNPIIDSFNKEEILKFSVYQSDSYKDIIKNFGLSKDLGFFKKNNLALVESIDYERKYLNPEQRMSDEAKSKLKYKVGDFVQLSGFGPEVIICEIVFVRKYKNGEGVRVDNIGVYGVIKYGADEPEQYIEISDDNIKRRVEEYELDANKYNL